MNSIWLLSGLLLLGAAHVSAQDADESLNFEVASVKMAPASVVERPGSGYCQNGPGPGTADPGLLTCTGAPLKLLIFFAYSVQPYQVAGPDWIGSTYYDIVAKVPRGATREQMKLMLRNLLKERFHLELSREKRERSTYTLSIAKGGPKIRNSSPDDASRPPAEAEKNGFPPFPPGGQLFMKVKDGKFMVRARNQPLSKLVQILGVRLGSTVVDETGLAGNFDYSLTYAIDDVGGSEDGETGNRADVPGLFAALADQLGLRLKIMKAPIEVLVVTHGDKTPVEN
jgi:uncharacterized protein (TIGR03435 family)